MLTFLEDTGLYSSWNGSAWVALDVSLISSNSFTTSNSVNLDGVFSTNFQNYRVALDLTSSSSPGISLQYRSGGVNETGNIYYYGGMGVGTYTNQTFFSTNNSLRTSHGLGDSTSASGLVSDMTIFNPNTIIKTSLVSHTNGSFMNVSAATTTSTTQYDGFRVFPSSGNITGTIRVYGLRN
jgi:hypothetical protein